MPESPPRVKPTAPLVLRARAVLRRSCGGREPFGTGRRPVDSRRCKTPPARRRHSTALPAAAPAAKSILPLGPFGESDMFRPFSRLHPRRSAAALLCGAVVACGQRAAKPLGQTPGPATQTASGAAASATPAPGPPTTGVGLGKLVFVRDGDVWVKELPAGAERPLTHGGAYDRPAWSPSGAWLSVRHQTSDGRQAQLVILRDDGTSSLTLDAPVTGPAAWSPTDDRLAYVTAAGVVVTDPGGSRRGAIDGATSVAWSYDGEWLAYTTTSGRSATPATPAVPQPAPGNLPAEPGERRTALWQARADGSAAREILGGRRRRRAGCCSRGGHPMASTCWCGRTHLSRPPSRPMGHPWWPSPRATAQSRHSPPSCCRTPTCSAGRPTGRGWR